MFDNIRDASSKLGGTIIMHDKRAMLVNDVTEDLDLQGTLIRTGEDIVTRQDDPLVKLYCPSLGYVNTKDNSFYFMRTPVRRWKQGVDMRALVCPSEGIRPRGMLDYRNLADCLENVYPSFTEALGMFENINPFKKERRRSIAFSKHFAVKQGREGMLLCFKGREVGVVEGSQPLLSNSFIWLQEMLEKEYGVQN